MRMFILKDCYDDDLDNIVVWGFDDEVTDDEVEKAVEKGKDEASEWLGGVEKEEYEHCSCDYDFVKEELYKLKGAAELVLDKIIEW